MKKLHEEICDLVLKRISVGISSFWVICLPSGSAISTVEGNFCLQVKMIIPTQAFQKVSVSNISIIDYWLKIHVYRTYRAEIELRMMHYSVIPLLQWLIMSTFSYWQSLSFSSTFDVRSHSVIQTTYTLSMFRDRFPLQLGAFQSFCVSSITYVVRLVARHVNEMNRYNVAQNWLQWKQ